MATPTLPDRATRSATAATTRDIPASETASPAAQSPAIAPRSSGAAYTDGRASWTFNLWDERLWQRLTLPMTLLLLIAIALAGTLGYAIGGWVGSATQLARPPARLPAS